jgi:hypothetical protein
MPAQPQEQRRSPHGTPAARPAPSPYRNAGALRPATSQVLIDLPTGSSVTVSPPVTSDGFIGGAFAMDSLAFLRWLPVYFHDDAVTLRVILYMMGLAEPGGLVEVTQRGLADALTLDQSQVSKAVKKLSALGIVHMPKRGRYQLQPQATLRGGAAKVEHKPGTRTQGARTRVDQLDLLHWLRQDETVPPEFKHLLLPPAEPRKRRRTAKTTTEE